MQLRAERTRRAILKSARKLFAAGGFAGTSVDAIALNAKVNKQRIYAYFGSKKQLFEAILLEVFSESAARFEEFASGVDSSSGDVTGLLVQYYRKLHREKPEFQRLLSWANLENAIDTTVLAEVRKSENCALRNWFENAQQQNNIRCDISFESWLLTIMGSTYFVCSNALTLSSTLGGDFMDDAACTRRCDDLVKLFSAT